MPARPAPPPSPPAASLPRALRPGDRILVVAPSSAPRSEALLAAGLDALRARGYRPEVLRDRHDAHGFLCGDDDARLGEFNRALGDPDASAIFCVRGGYGALRLLPRLDYDAARRHPKLLVGYSDVTALHLALYEKAGWRGLSGPMVAVEWGAHDAASEALFWHLARGGTADDLLGPSGEHLEPVADGEAEGVLLGGNLTLLTRLIGTPYLPDLAGAILFLEEIGEEPYRLDGLLAHLVLAGVFDRIGGLVLGGFTEGAPTQTHFLSQDDVLGHYTALLAARGVPVARGLVYGHFPVKNTLPVGVRARLAVRGGEARLSILEPVVRPVNLALFASGAGSNAAAILDAIAAGRLRARAVLLVADRPNIGALARAEAAGVPVAVVRPRDFPDETAFADALLAVLRAHGADFVALAGYLKRIPPAVAAAFDGRMVNIHPALLPDFGGPGLYGRRVHEAVLASGAAESGCTVHLVDEGYDTGAILAQVRVPVLPGDTTDTLGARVLAEEHKLYPEVLARLAEKGG